VSDPGEDQPRMSSAQRPDYGVDAPAVLAVLLVVSATALAVSAFLAARGAPHPLGVPLAEVLLLTGLSCLANAGAMLWYSKSGKLRQREQLLDLVPWRGDESVLDVGCGRGLLLVGAARRLGTGGAVGVDLWRGVDLSGNRPEAPKENARLEGVEERVAVAGGDARRLPFAAGSFDVVVSSLALHNLPDREGRERAVREVARVLRPGGHLALLDIQYTADYARVLKECGLADVRRTRAGRLFFWAFALLTWGALRFHRVSARKPAG
jgi:SAM-dependent methyltransferase